MQKYLDIAGYLEYINYKKINELIDKENTLNIDTDIFNSFIYNKRVREIFEQAYTDSLNDVLSLFAKDLKRIFYSLNNSLKENPKYMISLGTNTSFEGLIINNLILKVLSENDRFTNVNLIFKVKKDSNQELLNKVCELILNDKNISLSFVENSYNDLNVEYFSDGKRILENPTYDDEGATGRMLVSSISVNLSRLGLKHQNLKEFYLELDLKK